MAGRSSRRDGPARRAPTLELERNRPAPVCGIDEAGRGPLAGPVVAAAVILDPARLPAGIDDSKSLSPGRRETLFATILETAAHGIGLASVREIEEFNILGATMLAMRRAVAALPLTPAFALVDGNRLPESLPCPAEAIVQGDRRSLCIAAASILAKVTRDRLMADIARSHPGYGFERHMGYGTAEHLEALNRLGPTPEHRLGFAPVSRLKGIANLLNPK
ncbi:MAG: ribonuclease HII [Alphaproteobacteria bacterium]|nr:ribonuclease HII [Alphaproteobacteria bacterium]